MNIREEFELLRRRQDDLERRLEAIDGKAPVTSGGVTRLDGVTFVPGSGAMTERPPLSEVTALPVKPITSIEQARAALRRPTATEGTPQ